MEELERVKKRTKKLRWIATIILIIIIVIGITIWIIVKEEPIQPNFTIPNQEREIFNSRLVGFEGQNHNVETIKSLITKVNEGNEKYTNHIVKINGNDAKMYEIKSLEKKYNVKIEYDKDGYINNIIIAIYD